MKTLKEALFSKKNLGSNALEMKPYDFFKDIDKNFERTGPFVVKLISKSKQIEDHILFICEYNVVATTKIFNTFHDLKVQISDNINYFIKHAKDSGYFIAVFSNNVDKTKLYMDLPTIYTIINGIDNYTFGDYEYINNPDDPKELEDIYNDFILKELGQ